MRFHSVEEKTPLGSGPEKTVAEKIAPIIKKQLGDIFDQHSFGEQRVADFIARMEKLLQLADLNPTGIESVRAALEAGAAITNKEEFVEKMYNLSKLILKPEDFETIERKERGSFGVDRGFIALSEILFYEVDPGGESFHLHWAPSRTIPWEQKMELLLSGMRQLAKIVQDNEKIKTVYAASWIVAKWPDLLTQGGFMLDGPIDDEDREKYFADQPGEIHTAHIDREELLSRYGG